MCDDHRSESAGGRDVPLVPDHLTRRTVLLGAGAAALAGLARPGRRPGAGRRVAPDLWIQPRSVWGADLPPRGPVPTEDDVRLLLVHHSASPNTWSAIGTMRVTYWTHTGEKGWPDVCYQFFVDRDGVVYEGRDGSLRTTTLADATGGSQGYSQLVCLLGDFTHSRPTPAARRSLVKTLAFLAERSGLDTTPGSTAEFASRGSQRWPSGSRVTSPTIAPHRAMSYTSCPGDAFAPYVGPGLVLDVDRQRRRWRRDGWSLGR